MPNAPLTKETVVEALRSVREPASGGDVVSLGLVHNTAVCDGVVRVAYRLPAHLSKAEVHEQLRRRTTEVLAALAGVQRVNVEFGIQPAVRPAGRLPGVKHVIAVGAGKGGVGKSTVAALAAVGLLRRGKQVGLLDADVYGPSIPKITGTEGLKPYADEDGRIVPPERDGLRIMSMGYLVPRDEAVIWRGPMAQKYVAEFLDRGAWGELDYLIVDLPPGTGDIPLTLAQTIRLTGAVVVCTPQDVALIDAVKALKMYQRLGVEPLGIVENMSYYVCPHCGARDEIFSHGGAERAAADLGVPFLGAIPLNIAIRQNGDTGELLANFTDAPTDVVQSLEGFVSRLEEEVTRRAAEQPPLPTLRISG